MSSELPTAEPQFLIDHDYERFAPTYTPEAFTPQEQKYLKPFFTNLDKPVFAMHALPQEMMGALASRYSRAEDGLRRVFLRDYVEPMVRPWMTEDWKKASVGEKYKMLSVRRSFLGYVGYLSRAGGVDTVVSAKKARRFFNKWLADYGDDSIAELGAVHVCIEGASNIVANDVEMQRIGLSPLEKSSRYVEWKKDDSGQYPYTTPGELKGTEHETAYREVMDELFDVYSSLGAPYLDYIKRIHPKGAGETDGSFHNSRGAKRLDDLRDLLPFSTKTNLAVLGNGRACENLINRMMASDVKESHWWAQQIYRVLQQEVPSFVKRVGSERGEKMQMYRRRLRDHRKVVNPATTESLSSDHRDKQVIYKGHYATLIDHTPEPDVKILARFFQRGNHGLSQVALEDHFRQIIPTHRAAHLNTILHLRFEDPLSPNRESDRFNKPPRAFESATYHFAFKTRGGDYRDLQRHRMMVQDRHLFTTNFGYEVDSDLQNSPYFPQVSAVLTKAACLYRTIAAEISPEVAQYCVPMAFFQKWYGSMSAREIYWIAELRSGPQGRPHYRRVAQEMARAAYEASPTIFSALLTDFGDYPIARRESAIRAEKKRAAAAN